MIGDISMKIYGEEYYIALAKDDKYWRNRWEAYICSIVEELKILIRNRNIKSVLEIGCNGHTMIDGSHTLDKIKNENYPTYLIDLDEVETLPIADKKYDLVIATQVWEHLKYQSKMFKEVKRISKFGIFSFPYLWPNAKDITHYNITMDKIDEWTSREPSIVSRMLPYNNLNVTNKRVLRIYDFSLPADIELK